MKNIIKLSLDSFHLYFEQSNLDELLKMGGSKNEVKTSVRPPSAVRRPTMPFAVHSPPTNGPSHHKKLLFAGNYSYTLHHIGLTPLYWRRTSDDAMSGEVFYGRMDGRMPDKKRHKNFVLGSPS